MGYSTDFRGGWEVSPPLSRNAIDFLTKFCATRRMGRTGLAKSFGVEGEFYCEDTGDYGQGIPTKGAIIDGNKPPTTQPGLWCQWVPSEEGDLIEWDFGEKFYEYIAWIKYLVNKVLHPNGYTLNGEVSWRGDEWDDTGRIIIKDNVISVDYGAGEEIGEEPTLEDIVWADEA